MDAAIISLHKWDLLLSFFLWPELDLHFLRITLLSIFLKFPLINQRPLSWVMKLLRGFECFRRRLLLSLCFNSPSNWTCSRCFFDQCQEHLSSGLQRNVGPPAFGTKVFAEKLRPSRQKKTVTSVGYGNKIVFLTLIGKIPHSFP